MKLVIACQDFENYAWDENGVLGTGPNAHWKAKGGPEFVLEDLERHISPSDDFFQKKVDVLVDMLYPRIEVSNDGFRRTVIGWEVHDNDYMSSFERSQLEYDGSIEFYEPRIDIEGNISEWEYTRVA